METTHNEECGLTTRDALNTLIVEIETCLHQTNCMKKTSRGTKSWIRDTLSESSQHTTLNWISSVFLLWTAIAVFIKYVSNPQNVILIFESIFITLLLIVNLSLELYDNKLRHEEIPNRVRSHLERVKESIHSITWKQCNYPSLCIPMSPCITLQWTYRDGALVNLPWALLVKDDIVVMRPGQISPAYCEALDKNSDCPILHAKEVYAPSLQNANEIFSAPKSRQPLQCQKYRLLETPYLHNLRIYVEQALDRPITQLNQHRHVIMIRTMERVVLPITFCTVITVNLFRYFSHLERIEFVDLLILWPANTVLPLLPLVFPIAWNLINYLGVARFKTVFDTTRNIGKSDGSRLEEDTENATEEPESQQVKCAPHDVWTNFVKIVRGKSDILVHSSNILHVLGSITALGCVDKKGILSWPNPTAEKVFFLHNENESLSGGSSLNNVGDLAQDGDSIGEYPPQSQFQPNQQQQQSNNQDGSYDSPQMATVEVLDLTHNHSDPFRLHFDDQDWDRHISSLKPLGLAILLNTCNVETQESYTSFCSHITCEAIYNENLIPVTNRRCLCELAKEIGFVDQAQKIFSLETQLSTFRHLQPEMVRRDNKYTRSLHLSTKLKFPFPHMFAVVVKELSTGSMQLLSEGTADIILDSCVDYWDGHDLCPLTHTDRKRIQDFYQRSSLTAYCTAFAYRPLTKCVSSKLGGLYLELPSDSRHLYANYNRSPTPVHWECKSVLEPKTNTPLGQFYSTDSLLYNECPRVEISDAESCFQVQCNQIFIGMVTMQYQPLTDMVQLIEQLERACIRFVHFSKENELRSRVFSEKMGLESGWNCHISLLSERNSNLESSRTMSFSAPSAINMEHSVVKFDVDQQQERLRASAAATSGVGDDTNELCSTTTRLASRDSVQTERDQLTHDWQSLSCLTDSTEQSAPINFDMSNRAKLPRGIDKIRPHIELIDNVPLLVSLFTDCTPSATRSMLQIMQDYGEIVCIMGSSANSDNAGIFMQADASIALDPLFPQVCQKLSVYEPPQSHQPSPIDLAGELNAIACCLSLKRSDPVSLYRLVVEARHFVTSLWSAVQLWLAAALTLSLIQSISTFALLPAILSTGQVLYLSCFAIPALSLSLIGGQVGGADVMAKPQGKKQMTVGWDVCVFIAWCYGCKFVPVIVAVIVSSCGVLAPLCEQLCRVHNCTCVVFYVPSEHVWSEEMWTLHAARVAVMFTILVHFVCISAGFVYRDHLMHRRMPFKNLLWLVTASFLLLIQLIYTVASYYSFQSIQDNDKFEIPLWVIIFIALSPFLVLAINEFVKHEEIKVNKRYRRRVRLDFGTKLGMNSPF